MERFQARLCDGKDVLFDRVDGTLVPGGSGPWMASGRFDIRRGGLLGNALATDRPYRLVLEDGRGMRIHVTKLHASNSAGSAVVEFRGMWDQSEYDSAANPGNGSPRTRSASLAK